MCYAPGGKSADKTVVKHSVRSTLLCLGAGVVVQRVLQLVSFLIVGRTLGVAGLGIYAEGMAVAAILAVLAGAGVRNLVARAVSQQPRAARALVGHAVYMRLLTGLMLAIVATALAFTTSVRPWFWLLCAMHVVPAAFDLKNLVDAAGRTRSECWRSMNRRSCRRTGLAASHRGRWIDAGRTP